MAIPIAPNKPVNRLRVIRTDEIRHLRRRYRRAMNQRKLKTAGIIYIRLRSLLIAQMAAEIKQDREKMA